MEEVFHPDNACSGCWPFEIIMDTTIVIFIGDGVIWKPKVICTWLCDLCAEDVGAN